MIQICSQCKQKKKKSHFVKDNSRKTGYRKVCKKCRNKYLFYWRIKNIDLVRLASKRYLLKNPLKRKLSIKKHYDKIKHIPQKIKIKNKISRRWSKTPRGRLFRRISEEKRRKYVKESDDGTINFNSITCLLEKQGYKCAISGKDILKSFHIDHIIPLSKGGKHTISNIQLVEPIENLRKGVQIGK
jgi:5-methylcytosine-specific restriction endonuclease McrA